MDSFISQRDIQLLESVKSVPAITIVMPFEPKMTRKSEIELRLKEIGKKVRESMLLLYPAEQALPVLHKLELIVHGLNYNTHKRSLAIFVSPLVEKVFYLDTELEEKFAVDESFQIRDLIYCKKQTPQYLLLLLSAESSKMFFADGARITLIKSNIPDHVRAYMRDLPEKVSHFSDAQRNKEILLDKFLQHLDQGLALVLAAYPFPVFVLGAERVLGHFSSITHHNDRIAGMVHGNYLEATGTELMQLMQPHIKDWKSVRQQDILHKLQQAGTEKKLAYGLREVWKYVIRRNCRLLVVEKDYRHDVKLPFHSAEQQGNEDNPSVHRAYYISDAVDSLIELVLEFGGDVEFVDRNLLAEYGQIALIKYF